MSIDDETPEARSARAKAQAEIIRALLDANILPEPELEEEKADEASDVPNSGVSPRRVDDSWSQTVRELLAGLHATAMSAKMSLLRSSLDPGALAAAFGAPGELVPIGAIRAGTRSRLTLSAEVPSGWTHGAVLLVSLDSPSRIEFQVPRIIPPVSDMPSFSLARRIRQGVLSASFTLALETGDYLLLLVLGRTGDDVKCLADMAQNSPSEDSLTAVGKAISAGALRGALIEITATDD